MQLATVIGHATSTIKHPSLTGWRLVIAQPLGANRQPEADPIVAVDKYGSAPGQTIVFNSDGRGAREYVGSEKSPVRYFVVGIVDEQQQREMIFTARQLEELHKTNGHVTVAVGSRITPLAQDWLRAKKLTLKYGTNGSAPQKLAASAVDMETAPVPSQPRPTAEAAGFSDLLWWCDGPCGQAKAAIAQQARESNLHPLDLPARENNLVPAIKRLAGEVKSGRASGGLILVQSGAAAIIYANRCPSLRAILGTCRQSVEQGVQQLAANVLVIEHPYHSLPQVRNILIPFVRGGREMSDNVQRQLEELSSCT